MDSDRLWWLLWIDEILNIDRCDVYGVEDDGLDCEMVVMVVDALMLFAIDDEDDPRTTLL
jgi:hypothetical protein